jgi:hypothetical protein
MHCLAPPQPMSGLSMGVHSDRNEGCVPSSSYLLPDFCCNRCVHA